MKRLLVAVGFAALAAAGWGSVTRSWFVAVATLLSGTVGILSGGRALEHRARLRAAAEVGLGWAVINLYAQQW